MDLITYALCKNSGDSSASAAAAQAAQNAAETAQRAAETARDTAKSAQSAAEAARDAASGSAQGAASSAIAASDSAEDAQGYADDAQSSAQDAQTSAGNAQTAAEQAAGSATTAQGHAQTAQQAAQTAQDAAQALTGIGAEAQTLPPGSDATVTVQDGKIIYGIPAGQPGTGLPDATAEDAGKVPVVGADGSYALGDPVPQVDDTLTQVGAPADAKAAGDAIAAITPDDNSVGAKPWSSKQIIDALCPPLEETGNPVQCYPVAGYPLGVKATWQPRQAGTGDPSPENVRPIAGLDEVQVTRSGKNLMPYTKPPKSSYTSNGVIFTWNDDGSIHVSGTAVGQADSNVMNFDGFYLPPGAYRMIPSSQSKVTPHFVVKKGGTGTNIWYNPTGVSIENGDVPQYFYVSVADGATVDTTVYAFLSYGTELPTADDYSPYTGTTATLDFPSTVYGGEVDLATGEGMETVHGIVLDGTETWNSKTSPNTGILYFEFTVDDASRIPSSEGSIAAAKSSQKISHFSIGNPYSENVDNAGWVFTTGIQINYGVRICMSACADVNDWKSYLAAQAAAGTPVTIAYKLATPVPITTTGSQLLPALSGENVLITNADSLTVTGRAGGLGAPGEDGKSAYEIAVENGFQGTEEQWLASLKAPDDYNQLKSLPKINGVEVKGELTSQNLKIENFNPYLISSVGLMSLIMSGVGDGDYSVVDDLLGGVNNFKQAVMDNRLILIIPDGDIFDIRLFDIARAIQIEANKISFVVGNFSIVIEDNGETVTSFTSTQSDAINYNTLTNKPQINGVTLIGNQTSNSLNIKTSYTASDILFSDGESLQYKFDNKTLVVQ